MTPAGDRHRDSTIAAGKRGRRLALGRRREARTRRVFDGVVASYIRDISVRTASEAGREAGPAADAAAAA